MNGPAGAFVPRSKRSAPAGPSPVSPSGTTVPPSRAARWSASTRAKVAHGWGRYQARAARAGAAPLPAAASLAAFIADVMARNPTLSGRSLAT